MKKVYHGSDIIIKEPKLIKSLPTVFNRELGDGFYVFEKEYKKRALIYAVDTWLYNEMVNDIVVNEYIFRLEEFAKQAVQEFEERLTDENLDLIVSNILRKKVKNCISHSENCEDCKDECPKNKDVVCGILIDGYLDEKIIGKNFDPELSKEKLINIINNTMSLNSEKIIRQLRITNNISNYIDFVDAKVYGENDPEISQIIQQRILVFRQNRKGE